MSNNMRHFRKSGRGQPHSKTWREEWHAGERASVMECGCPLPLCVNPTSTDGIDRTQLFRIP
jgi:hypothetical protein